MRSRRLRAVPVLWLTVVWILLWGNLTWGNVLAGLTLGSAVLLLFPLPRLVVRIRVRPVPLAWLVLRFQWDLVIASGIVAWQAVRPGPVVDGRVMEVMLASRVELFQTLTAEMTALVPGTVVIDLDGHTGRLLIHALDVHTDEEVQEVRRQILALEGRVLRALAPDPLPEGGVLTSAPREEEQ